ncbi:MAG TPA: hypothetical protein VHJ34_11090 [Actinomycetota bacterium]|nr:hypothetical protein [Actinomycetota bacterium]
MAAIALAAAALMGAVIGFLSRRLWRQRHRPPKPLFAVVVVLAVAATCAMAPIGAAAGRDLGMVGVVLLALYPLGWLCGWIGEDRYRPGPRRDGPHDDATSSGEQH